MGSRRFCEDLMRAGRVTVDGKVVAAPGSKVDPEQSLIRVDGKKIFFREKYVTVLLYKPEGYVSTVKDPQGRPKVTDLVKLPGVRLFPVGRLDYQTSGLLLLTNDGNLAYLLTHPKYGIWKTYHALVEGVPRISTLTSLRAGVPLPEGRTAPAGVRLIKKLSGNRALLEIRLREGKKRQARKMCRFVGHSVIRLQRTGLAFLTLTGLQPGEYRFLSSGEVKNLKELAGKQLPQEG